MRVLFYSFPIQTSHPELNMYCMYSRFMPNAKSVSVCIIPMTIVDINIKKRFYGHENMNLEFNPVAVDKIQLFSDFLRDAALRRQLYVRKSKTK